MLHLIRVKKFIYSCSFFARVFTLKNLCLKPAAEGGAADAGESAHSAKVFESFALAFAHAAHLLHHFLHLVELFEQAVDILNLCAAARCNPDLAAGIDDFRLLPFFGGHR